MENTVCFCFFLTDTKPIGTQKNAIKRFQEASCQMRESVQRHLQSVPVISDDDDSSEEELAVNVLETVFESYSGTYGNNFMSFWSPFSFICSYKYVLLTIISYLDMNKC